MGGCLARLLSGAGSTSAKYVIDNGSTDSNPNSSNKKGVDTQGKLLKDFGDGVENGGEVIATTPTYTPKKEALPSFATSTKENNPLRKGTNLPLDDEEINVDANCGVVFFSNQGKGQDEEPPAPIEHNDLPDVIQTKVNSGSGTADITHQSCDVWGALEKKDSGLGATDSLNEFEANVSSDKTCAVSDEGSIGHADIEDIDISLAESGHGRVVSDSCQNLVGELDHNNITDVRIEDSEEELGNKTSGEVSTEQCYSEESVNKEGDRSSLPDECDAATTTSNKIHNVHIAKSESVDSATASQSEALTQSGPSQCLSTRKLLVGDESADEETTFHSEDSGVDVIDDAGRKAFPTQQDAEGGADPTSQGSQVEDRFYNNKAFQKPDVDTSDPQQQDAALKIQTKYRQYHAKQVVQTRRQEVAAVKIQSGYRGFQDRQKVKDMKTEEGEEAVTAEPDIDLDDPEIQDAATKIQAQFKGYQARKEVQAMKDKKQKELTDQASDNEELDIDLSDPEVGAAAVKIQANFKGFKARKEFRAKMEDQSVGETEDGNIQAVETLPAAEEVIAAETSPQVESAAQVEEEKQESEETGAEGGVTLSEEAPLEKTTEPQQDEAGQAAEATTEQVEQAEVSQTQETTEVQPEEQDSEKPVEEDSHQEPLGDMAEENEQTPGESSDEPKESGEVDIDLDDPEVAAAATKIQASFKGYKTRKDMAAKKEGSEEPTDQSELPQPEEPTASQTEQLQQAGDQSNEAESSEKPTETVDEPENAPADTQVDASDPEEQEGPVEAGSGKDEEAKPVDEQDNVEQSEKQLDNDDASDQEKERAAVKIQATFKGYQTRKELGVKKQESVKGDPPAEPTQADVGEEGQGQGDEE